MITVDQSSATPAFDQIREQLAGLIRVGALPPGHRLPSIRQLAGDLGIAPGTVARAFTELESAGLITSGRTGTFVRDGQAAAAAISTAAGRLASQARAAGLSLDDAVAALRASWSNEPAF